MKYNAYIGSWSFRPEPKGINRFLFDEETGKLELQETILEEIAAGAQYLDREKGILYISDEGFRTIDGAETGGVFAIQLNEDGSFGKVLSYTEAASPKTSYLWPVRGGRYLAASNHSSSKGVRHAYMKDGKTVVETVFDQASVNLFRLNEDGSVSGLADAFIAESEMIGGKRVFPHFHNVMSDPEGKMFISCDKGMDRILTFRVTENGRLAILQEIKTAENTAPRYTVFHPASDILFENNENWPALCSYAYNRESGELKLIQSLVIGDESYRKPDASDLVLDRKGRHLYAGLRHSNEIVTVKTDEGGHMGIIGRISCRGINPRGLYLFKNYLFVMNNESGNTVCFPIRDDGTPDEEHAVSSEVRLPGNMSIWEAEII